VGEYAEVISLADRILAQNAKAAKDKPAFDDVADKLNWIYDLKSQALRGLGRWDEHSRSRKKHVASARPVPTR